MNVESLTEALAEYPEESNAKLHAALAMLSQDKSVLLFQLIEQVVEFIQLNGLDERIGRGVFLIGGEPVMYVVQADQVDTE